MGTDEQSADLIEVDVEQREIGGVPAFVTDSPGPLRGGIVFRVGQADESLPERGLTHLVEHLAFAPLTEHRFTSGTVAMTETSFEARGEPGEVRDFINGIVASLASLPFDRLEVERRILRTEDQRRGRSLFALAHYLRYGPAAHGTIDCPELGLARATPESVDAWRRRWFTRGNAVMWFSSEPPEGLDLSPLAEGERIPPPEPQPYPYRYPAWYPGAPGYIAISMLAPRSTAVWVAQAVLRERLYERLRQREGRAYAVSVDYESLTAGTASIFVLSDTLPEEAEAVRDAISVELVRLARSGPEREEVEQLRALMRRATHEPDFPAFFAERSAYASLAGKPQQTGAELDAELVALTAEEAAAALQEAIDAALWLVPADIGVYDRRIHPLPHASEHAVDGTTYKRPLSYPRKGANDHLIVGPAGVSMVFPESDPSTIEFATCRAMQVFEDGARVLWGADGIQFMVHPGDWSKGEDAVAAIDQRVDPAVVITMGEDSGYEPPKPEPGGWNPFRRR
jgi:predicted Zn-dependent peptidase